MLASFYAQAYYDWYLGITKPEDRTIYERSCSSNNVDPDERFAQKLEFCFIAVWDTGLDLLDLDYMFNWMDGPGDLRHNVYRHDRYCTCNYCNPIDEHELSE